MAKNGFLDYLKQIIECMIDANKNIRVAPTGFMAKLNLSNNRIKLLSDLIKLLRDTPIITEETRHYIFNRYITISGVNQLINYEGTRGSVPVTPHNTQSKIMYDKSKLQATFGANIFTDVLSTNSDITVYEKILIEQYIKYSNNGNIRKNLVLNIPKECVSSELSDEAFEEFIGIIAPYTKNQIKFIEDNLDREACGYFNYILSSPNITGIDKQRANRLKTLLSSDNTKE